MRRLIVMGAVVACAVVVLVVGTGAGDDAGSDGYKVRAIFDNAFSLIEGEDVRVSGVNVGKISALDVTKDNRAAVTLNITRAGFDDFREDATCTIRPQGLIGERFVECDLTQPRGRGDAEAPPLKQIPDGEAGAGEYLLPVERTSKPVDIDLLNNVTRLPERQRLAIILNELGAGVAGRATDLNETIRRANPTLGATNQVLKILGEQNEVLRKLATDSDTALEPLANDRESVARFIDKANDVSRATADRREDLEANFERLPRFLEELRPTMTRLEGFADEFQPVLNDLRAAAPDINRMVTELGPFASASIPAFESLGEAADVGRPALVASKPIVDDIGDLLGTARPVASDLAGLATSLRDTGGLERLLDTIFFQVGAINGYDSLGHYLRAGLVVNTCTAYTVESQPGCRATFRGPAESSAARAAAADPENVKKVFAARAAESGEDRSAQALGVGQASADATDEQRAAKAEQPQDGALKMPTNVLPGQASTPAPKTTASAERPGRGGTADAQEGLLDYLLGGEGE